MNRPKLSMFLVLAVLLTAGAAQGAPKAPDRKNAPSGPAKAVTPPPRTAPGHVRSSYVPGPAYAHYVPGPVPVYVPAPRYRPARRVYVAPAAPVVVPARAYAPVARTPMSVGGFVGIGGLGGILTGSTGPTYITGSGGGFELFAGAEIGDWAGFELGYSSKFQTDERTDIKSATHGLNVDFLGFLTGRDAIVRPYLALGGGIYFLQPDRRFGTVEGAPGLDAGVGLQIKPVRSFSVGAKVSWRGIMALDGQPFGAPTHDSIFLNDVIASVRLGFHF